MYQPHPLPPQHEGIFWPILQSPYSPSQLQPSPSQPQPLNMHPQFTHAVSTAHKPPTHVHDHVDKPCGWSHKPPLKCNYPHQVDEGEGTSPWLHSHSHEPCRQRKEDMILIFASFIGSRGASTLMGGHCHTPPQFDLTELHHAHTHLMTDHDLTQSRYHHAGQRRTVSDLAISDISRHLQTGRDSALTASALHSATFSSTYFLF